MVVVGSAWEIGWNTPEKEYDLWKFPMREFGVDKLAFTPVSAINTDIDEFTSFPAMVEHYNLPVVICSDIGGIDIRDYKHPKDALYLLQRTSGGDLRGMFPKADVITIATPLEKGMMWGHQAASIIMYDRYLKVWQLQL